MSPALPTPTLRPLPARFALLRPLLAGALALSPGTLRANEPVERPLYIREYRVDGAKVLPREEVEAAVYPFLGPGRTSADVEAARAALESAYKAKGFQTVTVDIPEQLGRGGIVFLKVTETTVGRLRVRGSRYFSLETIKKQAPSMAEGKVINFNDVTHDIVGLNQWPERRVTPSLRAGIEPGTVDIDLSVKDSMPLHGSLELNNRYSPDTTALRLNGSVSYSNLWQLGHAIGLSAQVAPENPDDAKVLSAFYLARIPNVDWMTLTLQGTKQDSNVSTLGGAAVAGRGEILGLRASFSLPQLKNFYQTATVGLDYKHFHQGVDLGAGSVDTPITYYPLSAAYTGTWQGAGSVSELNGSIVAHLRGMGSTEEHFENKRFKASGNFIYVRGEAAHTHDLPGGLQIYGKVQGQASDSPLIDSEQFSGGGLGTVRGYLESEAVGDSALLGSIELRSPSFSGGLGKNIVHEWRAYVFAEGGRLWALETLAEQQTTFDLASIGFGTRMQLWDHYNGSLDVGLPLTSQSHTQTHALLLTFRLWADF